VLGWLPRIPWDPKRYFNRFSYWDVSTAARPAACFVHMVDVVHWYLGLTKPLSAVAWRHLRVQRRPRHADNINFILDYAGAF